MDFIIPDDAETGREQRISSPPVEERPLRRVEGSPTIGHTNNIVMPLGPRVHWGSILGGSVVALGLLILLTSLGLALGFSLVEHNWQVNTELLKSLRTGAGVWSAGSFLLAFFFAGMVSTKVTNYPDRGGAVLHGIITWAFLSLLLPVLMISRGALGIDGLTDDSTSSEATPDTLLDPSTTADEAALSHNLGLDDPSQVIVRLTDPRFPLIIAALTDMSDEEAQRIVNELQARVDKAKGDLATINAEVHSFLSRLLDRNQPVTPQASANPQVIAPDSWIVPGVLSLTLLAAILGALAGNPHQQRWRRTILIRA